MDKKFITALALSAVVTAGWFYFFPPPKAPTPNAATSAAPAATPATAPTPTTIAPAVDGGTTAATTTTTTVPAPIASAPAGTATAVGNPPPNPPTPTPVDKPAEQFITVEEPGLYRAKLTTYGGSIASWELLSPQYVAGKGKDVHPIELATKFGPSSTLTISSVGDLPIPVDAIYTVQPAGPNQQRLVYESDAVKVTKTFTFVPKTYELKVSIVVESKLDRATRQSVTVDLPGYHDPTQKGGGFFSPSVIVTEGICNVDGKEERKNFDKLLTDSTNKVGKPRWAAIDRKFFAAALAFAGTPTDGPGRCTVAANATGQIIAQLVLPERALNPKGTTELELGGFFGPKLLKDLDRVRVGAANVDPQLGDLMNYGLWGLAEWIARPLLAVLKAAHSVVPNWGIAVILLTILVKAALWWPTQKSMESMKKVAALKPEVDKLKARHGEDKNAFNMAVMELYRKEGVNPAGGCLPMLIQFPIFIGLFSMLGSSVELYRAPFVTGWIIDLTQPDPFYILPALLGGLMYVQQKVSPTAPDANQKTMMYGMQIAFVVASLLWPTGLTLYSLTNTLTSLLQQWLTNRKAAAAKPEAQSSSSSGSKPKSGKSNKKA